MNAGRIARRITGNRVGMMGGVLDSQTSWDTLHRRIARELREAYKRGVRNTLTSALICEEKLRGKKPIKIEQLQPRRIEIDDDDDDETERSF